jgi:hypothetical protein
MTEETKGEKYEISVTPGRTITAILAKIPLSKLKLDENNVRFRHLLKKLPAPEMEEIIRKEEDTKELCSQIEFSEGLQNPLIVDSNFIVKEGSRRLVCCRLLSKKKDISKNLFEKITNPLCIILPKDTSPEDIAIYLANVHVAGNKKWKAINKAAHIYDLNTKYGMTYDEIKDALSIGKDTITRMIKSFQTLMDYIKKYDDKDWIYKYSYFDELFKRKDLKEWSKSEENVAKFMFWIGTKKITQGIQVRDLSKILADAKALEVLNSYGFMQAMEVLETTNPAISSDFYKQIDKTQSMLFRMPREEMVSTAKNYTKLEMLKRLQNNLRILISEIEELKPKEKKKVT